MAEDDGEDYSDFMAGVFGTAIVMFVAQVLSSVMIANWFGATIQLALAFGFVPFLQIEAGPSVFVDIATWSTVATVAVVSTRVMVVLAFRRSSPQMLDGRAMGLLMSGLLLFYQFLRHVMSDVPIVDTWVFAQAAAGVIAATVIYLGFRPDGAQSARAETPRRPTRVERSTPSTQATNPRKSIAS